MKNIKQKYIYGGIATLFIFGLIIFSSTISIPKGANTASLLSPLWSLLGYSSEKEILSYFFKEPILIEGEFEEYNSQKYIFIEVPVNIARTGLTPIIKVSPGASVSPTSLFSPDYFKQPVVYTVTAADGTTQKYKVYLSGAPAIELPKSISTCQELQNIDADLRGNYKLANDIDCTDSKNWNSGAGFKPIGGYYTGTEFFGVLDGNGYTISNPFISYNNPGKGEYFLGGLFGRNSGTIKNLKVTGANFTFTGHGAIITSNNTNTGLIENVSIDSSSVKCNRISVYYQVTFCGGIAMSNYGKISNSSVSNTSVTGSGTNGQYASILGGIASNNGPQNGSISNSYTANVTLSGSILTETGSIAGRSYGPINNSYSYGSNYSLVGSNKGIIENSFNIGSSLGYQFKADGTYGTPKVTNSYYLNTNTSSPCFLNYVSGELASCTPVGDINYFKSTTNQPLSNWDFTKVWGIDPLKNNGYPYIKPIQLEPVIKCTLFDYSEWSTCSDGNQTRTVLSSLPSDCIGGSPVTSQTCTVCTSFNYSDWSACSGGTQTRTITNSSPSSCSGGNPITSQSCVIPIFNCQDLQEMNTDLSNNYVLENDINCIGVNFTPIGNYSSPFTGSFDGKGHVISNLTINLPLVSFVGLFGYTKNVNVSNIGLIDVKISGLSSVGGLVGTNNGSGGIFNSYVTGSIKAARVIDTSSPWGSFIDWSGSFVGGLVGYASTLSINNSYSIVDIEGYSHVGGLAGNTYTSITNSYSVGKFNVPSGSPTFFAVGGLVGTNNGSSVTNSYYYDYSKGLRCISIDETGCTRVTDIQMKNPTTFVGWDTAIWNLVDGAYPTLK